MQQVSNTPPLLVFDLDGTLADTAGDLVATLNAILAREGLSGLGFAEARANQTVVQNDVAVFSVVAEGVSPLTYQWYFNGTNSLAGAAYAVLVLTNVQPINAGNYSVVVTNLTGSLTSSVATLTVVPMIISVQPTNQSVALGNELTFVVSVLATGSCNGPFSYQWLHQGTNLVEQYLLFFFFFQFLA